MTAASPIVKITAKTALKNNWPQAITACAVFLFALLLNSRISSLTFVVLGEIPATVVFVLLSFLLMAPLFLGTVRFFWRLLFSVHDAPVSVFFYFSDRKLYARALSLTLQIIVRLMFFAVFLYMPALLVRIFSGTFIYDLLDISIPLWTANLYYLSVFLTVMASFALYFLAARYYLAPVLLAADEQMEASEAIHMSVTVSKGSYLEYHGLLLSMAGWALLCLFFIPLVFVLPYAMAVYTVHVRFAIADYNKRIKPSVSEPYPTFVSGF